jgi:hypothetical protein
VATLVMLGIVLSAIVVAAAWFAGEGTITQLFAQLKVLQENPPIWLQAPGVAHQKYLLLPDVWLACRNLCRDEDFSSSSSLVGLAGCGNFAGVDGALCFVAIAFYPEFIESPQWCL